jgi:hypothetical protein
MLAELARREEWPVAAGSLEYLCRRVGWLSPDLALPVYLRNEVVAGRVANRATSVARG